MRWRQALLVVLLGGCILYFILAAVREMIEPNAGVHDFGVYYRAAQALAHGATVYAPPPACCFNPAAMTGYTYPPVFAWLLIPLTLMPVDDAGRAWLAMSYVALLVILIAGVRAAPRRLSRETVAWLALALIGSGSVAFAVYEMQATPLVVALEAVFAYCAIRNSHVVLGAVCLALAAAFKVSPLLLAPALLLLPRPAALRAIAGLAGGLAVTLVVSLAVSPQAVFYATHVLPSFSGGVASPNNLSLPGVVLRTAVAVGIHPTPGLGTVFLVLEIVAVAATLWMCRGVAGADSRAVVIAALLAVTPIIQGVTWDHHLIADLLALILLAPHLRAWSATWVLAIGGAVLATANRHALEFWVGSHGIAPHNALAFTIFVATAALNLAGMCALWLATVLTARRMRSPETRSTPVLPRIGAGLSRSGAGAAPQM